jgi:thiol-disulfide isomerase/thioredoxin
MSGYTIAMTRPWLGLAALLLAPFGFAAQAPAASLGGEWDATVTVGALRVPCRFGLAVDGDHVSGWFYNGRERVTSTSGSLDSQHLVLEFASYARRLDVSLDADGDLVGSYGPNTPGVNGQTYAFRAERAPERGRDAANEAATAPRIAGLWIVPTQSHKANENAWRLIVSQTGAEVSAAILRVDGDTGALTGSWHHGALLLSHFDGARPALIEVNPGPQGTLALRIRGTDGVDQTLTAYRATDAQARGLPEAADPARHTQVANAAEPFQFSFTDLGGRLVTNSDPRFRGKVLVIDVAGSWCPNCHDEAPLLETLYRKYRRRGLEVVTLAFEEEDQLANPTRLRAFVRDFGLDYTVLLAGTPQQLHEKLPQAVGLDAYPTTFFIGRDGRVRAVHAGFAAPATGEFNRNLKRDFTSTIEKLLAEGT